MELILWDLVQMADGLYQHLMTTLLRWWRLLKILYVFGIKNLLFPYCKMNTILQEYVWYCKNKNPLKCAQLSTCGLVIQLVVAPNNHLGGMGLNLIEAWILSRLQWPARTYQDHGFIWFQSAGHMRFISLQVKSDYNMFFCLCSCGTWQVENSFMILNSTLLLLIVLSFIQRNSC